MDEENNHHPPNKDATPLEPWVDPALEARIVALILGESSEFEQAELHIAIKSQPEVKAFYDRILNTHQSLQQSETAAAAASWKLPSAKRDALLETFRSKPAPADLSPVEGEPLAARKKRVIARLAPWLGVAAAIMLLLVAVLPPPRRDAKSERPAVAVGASSDVEAFTVTSRKDAETPNIALYADISRDKLSLDIQGENDLRRVEALTMSAASSGGSTATATAERLLGDAFGGDDLVTLTAPIERGETAWSGVMDESDNSDGTSGKKSLLGFALNSPLPDPEDDYNTHLSGARSLRGYDYRGAAGKEEAAKFYATTTRDTTLYKSTADPGVTGEWGQEVPAGETDSYFNRPSSGSIANKEVKERTGDYEMAYRMKPSGEGEKRESNSDFGYNDASVISGVYLQSTDEAKQKVDKSYFAANGTIAKAEQRRQLGSSVTDGKDRVLTPEEPGVKDFGMAEAKQKQAPADDPERYANGDKDFDSNGDGTPGSFDDQHGNVVVGGVIANGGSKGGFGIDPDLNQALERPVTGGVRLTRNNREFTVAEALVGADPAGDGFAGFGGGGAAGGGGQSAFGVTELQEKLRPAGDPSKSDLNDSAVAAKKPVVDSSESLVSRFKFAAPGDGPAALPEVNVPTLGAISAAQTIQPNSRGFASDTGGEALGRGQGQSPGEVEAAAAEDGQVARQFGNDKSGQAPNQSGNQAGMLVDETKPADLTALAEVGQHSLTPNSKAPEITLLGQPRVDHWPSDSSEFKPENSDAVSNPVSPVHAAKVAEVDRDLRLATGYSDIGDYDKAEKNYNEVLRVDKYNETARRGLEQVELARQDHYKNGRDHMRGKMLSQVDERWEWVPPAASLDDDESAKLNIDAAAEATSWDIPRDGTKAVNGLEDRLSSLDDFLSTTEGESIANPPGLDVKELELNQRIAESREEMLDLMNESGIVDLSANAPQWYESKTGKLSEEDEEESRKSSDYLIARAKYEEDKKRLTDLRTEIAGGKRLESKKAIPDLSLETLTSAEPFSTFSLNVSDVSFKLARTALLDNSTYPNAAKVRVEEFVNAFDYGDPCPTLSEKVACQIDQAAHPFLQQRNLMRVSMRTAAEGRAASQPLRLTILLDKSGSMERADREESVLRTMQALAKHLGPADKVTAIAFARQPRLITEQLSGDRAEELVKLVAATPSEGGTNLEEALKLADKLATRQFEDSAINRIVLITDGAANLGDADPESLKGKIIELRQRGIAFDACGVGADGLNDATLEALTRKGDGRYYFLDRPQDADEGFVRQLAGSLRPAAKNVKVQVKFNPERVTRYRLAGFEKHRLNKEDFRNDKVDAAEMAAAEAGNALYQFEADPQGRGDVGEVFVRFLDTSTNQMVERSWPIPYQPRAPRLEDAKTSMQLAATAGLLAEKLKGGPTADTINLADLTPITNQLRSSQDQKINDLIQMVEKARSLK